MTPAHCVIETPTLGEGGGELEEVEYFTLTNDLWTSLSTESCLAVACQFKIKIL